MLFLCIVMSKGRQKHIGFALFCPKMPPNDQKHPVCLQNVCKRSGCSNIQKEFVMTTIKLCLDRCNAKDESALSPPRISVSCKRRVRIDLPGYIVCRTNPATPTAKWYIRQEKVPAATLTGVCL